MTAELLAQNVVAHWMQAAGVAGKPLGSGSRSCGFASPASC